MPRRLQQRADERVSWLATTQGQPGVFDRTLRSERFAHAATEAIAAVNAHDQTRFLECFDAGATIDDCGDRAVGIDAISQWVHTHLILSGVTWESAILLGGTSAVSARTRWHAGGYVEPRTLAFTLVDGLISELIISA